MSERIFIWKGRACGKTEALNRAIGGLEMKDGDSEIERRSDVIERHKRELVALVGLVNEWSARLMSETHVALRLEWDKATTPHTLICGVYLVEDGVQHEISGPEFGRLYAIIDEIHAKVSEMKALEIGATLAIHKITSTANPDGRNILAAMEVAPLSSVVRGDYGASVQAEVGDTVTAQMNASAAEIEEKQNGGPVIKGDLYSI